MLRLITRQATPVAARAFRSTAPAMVVSVGDPMPIVDLGEVFPKKVNTTELFKGRRVLLVGIPAAFTGTCNTQVTSYATDLDKFKEKGVDAIYVVSVNDPFVMKEWARVQDPEGKLKFLADAKGELARHLDIVLDMPDVFGNPRMRRFSALVDDMEFKLVNVEPDGTGYTCSKPTSILDQIPPRKF